MSTSSGLSWLLETARPQSLPVAVFVCVRLRIYERLYGCAFVCERWHPEIGAFAADGARLWHGMCRHTDTDDAREARARTRQVTVTPKTTAGRFLGKTLFAQT